MLKLFFVAQWGVCSNWVQTFTLHLYGVILFLILWIYAVKYLPIKQLQTVNKKNCFVEEEEKKKDKAAVMKLTCRVNTSWLKLRLLQLSVTICRWRRLQVSGRGCRWRSQIQLSGRICRWRQRLQVGGWRLEVNGPCIDVVVLVCLESKSSFMSFINLHSTHICPRVNDPSPSKINQEGPNSLWHLWSLSVVLHDVVAVLHHLKVQQGKTYQGGESELGNSLGKVECKQKMFMFVCSCSHVYQHPWCVQTHVDVSCYTSGLWCDENNTFPDVAEEAHMVLS